MNYTMKKRGYFFTLDVIIAMVIMVVGFVLIWANVITETGQRQPYFYAQDMLDILSTTKNIEVSRDKYVQDRFLDGNISDLEIPALEQIVLFYWKSLESPGDSWRPEMTINYTERVTKNLIPSQYSYEISIDRVRIYNQSGLSNRTQNTSDILINAKKLIIIQTGKTSLSPVFLTEVKVWR